MPFVTSEIYPNLIVFGTEDLIVAKWPDIRNEFVFDKEEHEVEILKKVIVEIRNVRSKMNVHPSKKSKLIFVTENMAKVIEESEEFLSKLGFASEIVVQNDENGIPENAVSIIVEDLKIFIPFEDLVNIEEEIQRLEGEKKKLEGEVARGEKMLSNQGFISKAPQAKIDEEKAKLENYKNMLFAVEERLEKMKK